MDEIIFLYKQNEVNKANLDIEKLKLRDRESKCGDKRYPD